MGFIRKLLLPNEVDFNQALSNQVEASKLMMDELYKACVNDDLNSLKSITLKAKDARELKTKNMLQLLDVFITPYDKESIYRMITQLDWIALSIKHFQLEVEVYEAFHLSKYEPILKLLVDMLKALQDGMSNLTSKKLNLVATSTEQIHDQYDQVVGLCANANAELMKQDDCKHIIRYKDMLNQLKEIAKRIHVSANTLEDMAIKVI